MDETRASLVQRPDIIVARKGLQQIGALVSVEMSLLVTLTSAVRTIENYSPTFLF